MSLLSQLLAIACVIGFFAAIFYVLFGQITVRKLRKNSKTKDKLGFEYVSGWDIINVAQSLSIPRKLSKKLENTPLSFLYANSELLHDQTNLSDRILAAIFYWLLTISGVMMIFLAIADTLGFFDS
ncbi:hypothetical protein [Thalassolituus oleivorans]|uniref:hypothetical protein n=1 Tax=Thalassolituus oleivorans TaxID=187493 RepID=UPI0023F306FF|nr:hypothetical protein [Thalassolituus oleivorans]